MGNCVRSQVAEAIARHAAADIMIPESAGISPLGFIDKTAREVLLERGISMDGQFSKGLHHHALVKPDLIVNMSGLPGEAHFRGQLFEDWSVKDPFGESMETHRRVCDDIQAQVLDLAARLRGGTPEMR
jgi:arsenate reductase